MTYNDYTGLNDCYDAIWAALNCMGVADLVQYVIEEKGLYYKVANTREY